MGVEFNDENQGFVPQAGSSAPKGITGWLIKKGYAKDIEEANKKLLMAALIFFLLTVVVIVI